MSKSVFMSVHREIKKVTTNTLLEMKRRGEKISMLTAYDYTLAKIIDDAGIDVILVGDSASNVMSGNETTVTITLEQMIFHGSWVVKAVNRALVVVDMPFGSYQGNSKTALQSAIRLMKEAGAHAVKLEGGGEVIESVKRLVDSGIPVMGHLGLTPQSIYKFGTYTVRAREVLVLHDMLGLNKQFNPRFLRRYLNLYDDIKGAVNHYISDVKSGDFPSESEQY